MFSVTVTRRAWNASSVPRKFASLSSLEDRVPVIVSFARTPIGRFNGELAGLSAPHLGAAAIKGAVERAGLSIEKDGAAVDEVLIGNVCAAGMGQAPATQSMIYAGLPNTIPATTVHKVCASGMKTAMWAADAIRLGRADIVVAGGIESMSNIPHYLQSLRGGVKMGNGTLVDGVIHDGLWDPYGNMHMGNCGEVCASEMNFSKEDQDAYARASYEKALSEEAQKVQAEQIVPVEVPLGRKKFATVSTDGEPGAAKLDKMSKLRPAFKKDGTITAANASKLNDGAAAMVIMSAAEARKRGAKPLAAIRGYADANHDPTWFTTAPAKAVPIAIEQAGLKAEDMELHEINEAFSVVALANTKLLNLDPATVNVYGGAVAYGHPIGCSGARILGQLAYALKEKGKRYGTASICNGGGGASAVVLEALE